MNLYSKENFVLEKLQVCLSDILKLVNVDFSILKEHYLWYFNISKAKSCFYIDAAITPSTYHTCWVSTLPYITEESQCVLHKSESQKEWQYVRTCQQNQVTSLISVVLLGTMLISASMFTVIHHQVWSDIGFRKDNLSSAVSCSPPPPPTPLIHQLPPCCMHPSLKMYLLLSKPWFFTIKN